MDKQNVNTELQKLLLKHYAPASAQDSNTMDKSTGELFTILDEHAPGQFSIAELYPILLSNKFEDRMVGESLVWRLKRAT